MNINCFMCGACCVAYDISALDKQAGERCVYLKEDGLCDNYTCRPQVCRSFKADGLCVFISSLTFDEKIKILKKVYVD